jgi:hypothetical protein
VDETALLQPLFDDPLREVVHVRPGYASHASDVWLVRTDAEEAVVRASRLGPEARGPFHEGCRALFGSDPSRVWDLEAINGYLGACGALRVPRVLRRGWVGSRPCVVVERLPGTSIETFAGASPRVLADLGRGLAEMHRRTGDWFGTLTPRHRVPLDRFPTRLAESIAALIPAYRPDLGERADGAVAAARRLPVPPAACPIMPDLDPTQFLVHGDRLSGLVDTEYCCAGPRELDFVALEYVLDRAGARIFAEAYARVLGLPVLGGVRPLYRLLYLLLEVQGRGPFDGWMAQPALFD